MRRSLQIISSVFACLFCTIALGKTHYTISALPDQIASWQFLTNDGRVLGLDSTTGNAVLWNADTGALLLQPPVGAKWSTVSVSPGGRFLGIADYLTAYQGMLDTELSPVSWPTKLPANLTAGGNSTGGITSGGATLCIGACSPSIGYYPPYVPQPPRYHATAINDAGTLVGMVSIDRGNARGIMPLELHAMRLSADGVMEATQAALRPIAINTQGDALLSPVILFGLNAAVTPAITLWTADGQFLSIDPPPDYPSFTGGFALNDFGQVAGTALNASSTTQGMSPVRGFVWTPGKGSIVLGEVAGFPYVSIHAMNNSRQVVGSASNTLCTMLCILNVGSTHAVLWTPKGVAIDLNEAINLRHNASGVKSLWGAQAINDAGQSLATGEGVDGVPHTYLLSPHHTDADSGWPNSRPEGFEDESPDHKSAVSRNINDESGRTNDQ